MPASVQIADEDVHNHPGITAIPDEDVHNHPSSDPSDPTPLVSTSQINPADVPEYERDVAGQASLTKGANGPDSDVAYVADTSPNTVHVDDPTAYSAADQAHELQHVVQQKNTSFAQKLANIADPSNAKLASTSAGATGDKAPYDYGGTEGLAKHLASGKTIADFNAEQQASIPQNYMKEYNKAVKAGDAKAIDRLNEVYQPAIKQLRNMANPSKITIDTTPDAPGGAPAELLGSAKPVKGMASNSTKSAPVRTMVVDNPKGLVEKGNLNIDNRPVVKNADGSHSTEYSTSFNVDGKEVLLPTVVNGKFLTPDGKKPPEGSKAEKQMFQAALQHYRQTGEHLGKFKDAASADAYANILHNRGNQTAISKPSWKDAASALGRR